MRNRIRFLEDDGLTVIGNYRDQVDAFFFIDPLYTAGGKRAESRLYTHADLDHEALFHTASQVAGDFLITYDNADELHDLARHYNFDTQLVAMKSTHHTEMTELLIGRNLDWAR